jgi:hypothetical protein
LLRRWVGSGFSGNNQKLPESALLFMTLPVNHASARFAIVAVPRLSGSIETQWWFSLCWLRTSVVTSVAYFGLYSPCPNEWDDGICCDNFSAVMYFFPMVDVTG